MATETYCDWEACKLRVSASVQVFGANLDPNYDPLIAQACRDAAAEIKRIFILKGYSPDQLAACDDIRVWNEQLGAYFAFVRISVFTGWDQKAVDSLNCIERMEKASALVIDGTATAGGGTEVGGIRFGQVTAGVNLLPPRFNNPGQRWWPGCGW